MVVYNSLFHGRSDVHCVNVDSVNLALTDAESKSKLHVQLEPVFTAEDGGFTLVTSVYKMCFTLQLGANQMRRFTIVEDHDNKKHVHMATVVTNGQVRGDL